jgi:hypothetical protein
MCQSKTLAFVPDLQQPDNLWLKAKATALVSVVWANETVAARNQAYNTTHRGQLFYQLEQNFLSMLNIDSRRDNLN